jgi:hypothetical protein
MPVGPSASRSAIQLDTLSLGLKDPKSGNLLSSGAPPGSRLTPLNPTIAHTKKSHLASIVAITGSVIFDIFCKKLQEHHLHNITIDISSLATHNTLLPILHKLPPTPMQIPSRIYSRFPRSLRFVMQTVRSLLTNRSGGSLEICNRSVCKHLQDACPSQKLRSEACILTVRRFSLQSQSFVFSLLEIIENTALP